MSEDYSFMNEKIKGKPFYKKKPVQIAAFVLGMGILFGAVSALVFSLVFSWVDEKLKPGPTQNISFPEDEIPGEVIPGEEITDGSIGDITDLPGDVSQEYEVSISAYEDLYVKFRSLADEAGKSIVTITATSNGVDWFNEDYENAGHTTGLIVGNNGIELLVLTDYNTIKGTDGLKVQFFNGENVGGNLKTYDTATGLAIVGLSLNDIDEATKESAKEAVLGSSLTLKPGTPVIVIGMPDGTIGSMEIGTFTSTNNVLSVVDGEYNVLSSDIMANSQASGVMIDLEGKVIGIVEQNVSASTLTNQMNAYGISDLKVLLERMTNNQGIAYLGVTGVTVTDDVKKVSDMSAGVYITEVVIDSPAMVAGVQNGDIITSINGQEVKQVSDISKILTVLSDKQTFEVLVQRQTKEGYKQVELNVSQNMTE